MRIVTILIVFNQSDHVPLKGPFQNVFQNPRFVTHKSRCFGYSKWSVANNGLPCGRIKCEQSLNTILRDNYTNCIIWKICCAECILFESAQNSVDFLFILPSTFFTYLPVVFFFHVVSLRRLTQTVLFCDKCLPPAFRLANTVQEKKNWRKRLCLQVFCTRAFSFWTLSEKLFPFERPQF